MTLEDYFFEVGVKRTPGKLVDPPAGKVLNLGSGYAPIPGAINLDRPHWFAPDIPYDNVEFAAVHMHHFLEHLDPDLAYAQLIEVERVLIPGGVCFITVPHAMCPLAFQAPDHRSYWTEEGFQDTFYSAGYDSSYGHEWRIDISWMKVAGVRWSNLCVLVQLFKPKKDEPFLSVWDRRV